MEPWLFKTKEINVWTVLLQLKCDLLQIISKVVEYNFRTQSPDIIWEHLYQSLDIRPNTHASQYALRYASLIYYEWMTKNDLTSLKLSNDFD